MRKLFILCLLNLSFALHLNGQSSEFTYQGRLVDGSLAASGAYEMRFRLFDAETDGTQQPQPTPITLDFTVANGNPVTVATGVFTVKLNFTSAAFPGPARWLEIYVRRTAADPFTLLNPRQPITSAPHNIKSLSSDGLSVACVLCVTDAQMQSIDGSKVTGTVANATTAVNVSGIVPIANGGTGSSTKNFVDLSTNQNVSGNKTFNNAATFNSAVTVAGSNNTLTVDGSLNVAFNVTADQFFGDGSGLTNVNGTMPWQQVSGLSQQAQKNTGYLANNAAQVTITLPDSTVLGFGDIVRVSGIGVGGWKIAQNAGQLIIGTNINSMAANWVQRENNRNWKAVAISADGSKLVAAGIQERIYTSSDSGVSWTPREVARDWNSVASSVDGTKLVAVPENGLIYTSTDSGVSWTPRETARLWRSVASSADGSKLVAVATFNGQIYTSTDSGVSWTPRESVRNWQAVASSVDGSKLAAAVFNGQIYTSTDSGVSWTPRESVRNWNSVASSADGSKLAAVASGGQIYTSDDSGVNWTPRAVDRNWTSIASSANGSRLVAVASGGQIYLSGDSGLSWMPLENVRNWQGVASSPDGTKLVAVANGGRIYISVLITTLGTAGFLTGGQFSAIELQYIGNGQFMPISYVGGISGF